MRLILKVVANLAFPLNGLVSDLHRANLYRLYDELQEETAVPEGGVA